MKHYRIKITDGCGTPRIVTVRAFSVIDAINNVECRFGDRIVEVREVLECTP